MGGLGAVAKTPKITHDSLSTTMEMAQRWPCACTHALCAEAVTVQRSEVLRTRQRPHGKQTNVQLAQSAGSKSLSECAGQDAE
eukprot:4629886-Amphidinium_carterae.1